MDKRDLENLNHRSTLIIEGLAEVLATLTACLQKVYLTQQELQEELKKISESENQAPYSVRSFKFENSIVGSQLLRASFPQGEISTEVQEFLEKEKLKGETHDQ